MKNPKEVIAAFIDAHNRHNIEELLSYLADDSTMIDVAAPIPLHSKADVRRLFEMIFSSIPNVKFEATGMVAEGNQVFVALRTTGTGAGVWAGSNIAGKAVDVYEGMHVRIENGKIQDTMFYSDTATLTKQLGYQTAVSKRY
jgi:steroid delta-isomerase-like uncharacterized protein